MRYIRPGLRYLGCALCALVLAAVVASPAWAAFPGRDGLLAVQPVSGGGVVLVNARGGSERRICTDRSRCGSPKTPRWSPDGGALAFSGPTIDLIYPDGSCLDCQIGGGDSPAFTADPAVVSFESAGALVEDGIDGLREATVVRGSFSDAVWSSRGELAVVRGGSVWAGSPHKLRRIAAGSAPSWSPSARQLAIERGGWVLVVNVRTRSSRRLVRGSAPAFSPDGKSIAFIAAGHRVRIAPAAAGGGAARSVGSVRGVSVDWQPLPKKAPACVAPPGSKVLASSSTAIVTSDSNSTSTVALGCLRANGRERLLERLTDSPGITDHGVSTAAVGDDYAALLNSTNDFHTTSVSDVVEVFDLHTGDQVRGMGGEAISCVSPLLAADGCYSDLYPNLDQVVVGRGGISAAYFASDPPPNPGPNALIGVSCPSASLCVAVDGISHLFTSTDPTGGTGAWTGASVPGLAAVSCPSVSLCVGVADNITVAGGSASVIYASTDPTGGAGAWYPVYTAAGDGDLFTDISCPSASLCVAVGRSGTAVTSTDPAGGPAQWSAADIDGVDLLASVSCPSVSLCVATDVEGNVLTSTNPAGGAGAWQTAPVVSPGIPGTQSISCPSSTLCVDLTPNESLYTSTNPTAPGSWTATSTGLPLDAVDCPSTSLCVAVGSQGALDTSTDPAAAGTWTPSVIDDTNDLDSISCASSTLCVAGDEVGDVVATSNPTGGPAGWVSTVIDGDVSTTPCTVAADECTVEQIIAKDSTGLRQLDSTNEYFRAAPALTDLSLSGDRVTWKHYGTAESAVLTP